MEVHVEVQDFPYTCEAGIEHHNIWCTVPMSSEAIEACIQEHRPPSRGWQTMFFINPEELQSVPTVRCCPLPLLCACNVCSALAWLVAHFKACSAKARPPPATDRLSRRQHCTHRYHAPMWRSFTDGH